MKCFNHPQNDAIAICKNCYKALCKECTIELANGIACKDSKDNCIIEVENLNRYLDTYKISAQRTKVNFSRSMFLTGLLGITFLVIGILMSSYNVLAGLLPIVLGVISLFSTVTNFFEKRRYDKLNK